MAKLVYNLEAIRHNAKVIISACRKQGISLAFVNKVSCADTMLARAVIPLGASQIADSRLENLAKYGSDYQKMLLRLSENADETVKYSDISLESEEDMLISLDTAAKKQGKTHKVVLMIDLGDLREGIFIEDRDKIISAAKLAASLTNIELLGVGTNLSCFGGILPTVENLDQLVEIAETLRKETKLPLPLVSGGNSSTLPLIFNGTVPKGITHIRIGESLLLGTNTQNGEALKGLRQDTVSLVAKVIELKEKPSKPIGKTGLNAFGEEVCFEDKGKMLRAILAIGKQDVAMYNISPVDENLEIIGASSDHLILDATRAKNISLNHNIRFKLSYGGLLSLATSPYIKKEWEVNSEPMLRA